MLSIAEYLANPIEDVNVTFGTGQEDPDLTVAIFPCIDGYDIHVSGVYKASISLDKQADLWFITRGELNNIKLLNETVSRIGAKYYR